MRIHLHTEKMVVRLFCFMATFVATMSDFGLLLIFKEKSIRCMACLLSSTHILQIYWIYKDAIDLNLKF